MNPVWNEKKNFFTVASDSSDEEIEESEEIKNAYIPYLYAKKNIIKVIKDMKRMRSNHIHIVADIQKEYKGIEDETQVYFRLFLNFHEQYLQAESPRHLHQICRLMHIWFVKLPG